MQKKNTRTPARSSSEKSAHPRPAAELRISVPRVADEFKPLGVLPGDEILMRLVPALDTLREGELLIVYDRQKKFTDMGRSLSPVGDERDSRGVAIIDGAECSYWYEWEDYVFFRVVSITRTFAPAVVPYVDPYDGALSGSKVVHLSAWLSSHPRPIRNLLFAEKGAE